MFRTTLVLAAAARIRAATWRGCRGASGIWGCTWSATSWVGTRLAVMFLVAAGISFMRPWRWAEGGDPEIH